MTAGRHSPSPQSANCSSIVTHTHPIAHEMQAIAGPESYELLVRRGGYSPEEFVEWMDATLTAALLA